MVLPHPLVVLPAPKISPLFLMSYLPPARVKQLTMLEMVEMDPLEPLSDARQTPLALSEVMEMELPKSALHPVESPALLKHDPVPLVATSLSHRVE